MKNCTKIDLEIQMELIKITSKKPKVILFIVGIIIILSGLYVNTFDDSIGLGLVFGGIAVIIIFVFLWNKLMIKQFKNNHLFNGETVNVYEFEEDKLMVKSIKDEEEFGQSRIKYSDIFKIMENKEYLFIFISNVQAYVLSKDKMTEGNIEDVITLLKLKVNKYKVEK